MKSIKELEEFNRPREKLAEKGVQSLSDIELVAILLGSGNKGLDKEVIYLQCSKKSKTKK